MIYPKIFILSVLMSFVTLFSYGQAEKIDFEYESAGKTYSDNSFMYRIDIIKDGQRSNFSAGSPTIDLQGVNAAVFEVFLYGLKLDPKLDEQFRNTASLGINRSWIKATCCMEIQSRKNLFIRQGEEESLKFDIKGPGSGTLIIEMGLRAEGQSVFKYLPFKRKIERAFTIKNSEGSVSIEENTSSDSEKEEKSADDLLIEEAEKKWNAIKKSNQVSTFESFIKEFPNTTFEKDARIAITNLDKRAWNSARKKHTISGYQYYLKKFPKGLYSDSAEEKIGSIRQEAAFIRSANSAEKTAWEKARDENTRTSYENYLDKFPDGQFKDIAKDKIQESLSLEIIETPKSDGVYSYELIGAKNPQIDLSTISEEEEENIDFIDSNLKNLNKLDVKILKPGQYAFSIIDDFEKSIEIEIDNMLMATVSKDTEFAGIDFEFSNGVPPYSLKFVNLDRTDSTTFDNLNNKLVSIAYQDIQEANLIGDLTVYASDSRPNSEVPIEGIHIPGKENNFNQYLIYAGITAVIALIAFFFGRKKKPNKASPAKPTTAAMTNNKSKVVPPPTVVVDETLQKQSQVTTIKEIRKAAPVANTKPRKTKKGESRIRIHNIEGKRKLRTEMPFDEFQKMVDEGAYLILDLEGLWESSAISEIMMEQDFAAQLDKFLREENLDIIVDEVAGNTPEVGGFLMGKYCLDPETNQYQISLNEFIPIVPEDHSVFQLEFSTNSLVRELGDAQDKFPDLSVIGWFHTHPGHGLFLSKPDMTIHRGFFKEKYQVAMEIDSLSEKLDTGFFTKKMNDEMNNSIYKRPSWFSWRDIEKTLL